MYNWVFLNSKFVEKENAKISVFDHGFLYGDGIFEGIRIYYGKPFYLREHILRLFESAKAIYLTIPYSVEEIESFVYETLKKNNCLNEDGYIRLIISRGDGELGGHPGNKFIPNVIIILENVTLFSEEVRARGIELITVSTRKPRQDSINTQAKTLNYLNNQISKLESVIAGGDEALVLDINGYVSEGSKQNIFIIKDNVIITPPCSLGALKGITRSIVIELAKEMKYKVSEKKFTVHEVYNANEAFLTGTGSEIVPIRTVDGRAVGEGCPGDITNLIYENFKKKIRKQP